MNSFIEAELEELRDFLQRIKAEKQVDNRARKQIEKAIKRFEAKLVSKSDMDKDSADTITWDQMGIDMLVGDEWHIYKNLFFHTKMTRIAVEPAGVDRFLSKCYDNFILVADACRRTGRGFWYIPQVNSREGQPPTSEDRLRFQACAAMILGAEAITRACWSNGWWTNNVLDAAGVPTAQYGKLKKVNAELKRLGPEYMKFRSTATHFVGFPSGSSRNPKEPVSFPDALDAGFFKGVRASNGAPLLVGEMSARDRACTARALFVTAADDPEDAMPASFEVIFRAPGPKAYGGDGPLPVRILPDGCCSVPLRSCHGVLVVSGE